MRVWRGSIQSLSQSSRRRVRCPYLIARICLFHLKAAVLALLSTSPSIHLPWFQCQDQGGSPFKNWGWLGRFPCQQGRPLFPCCSQLRFGDLDSIQSLSTRTLKSDRRCPVYIWTASVWQECLGSRTEADTEARNNLPQALEIIYCVLEAPLELSAQPSFWGLMLDLHLCRVFLVYPAP